MATNSEKSAENSLTVLLYNACTEVQDLQRPVPREREEGICHDISFSFFFFFLMKHIFPMLLLKAVAGTFKISNVLLKVV